MSITLWRSSLISHTHAQQHPTDAGTQTKSRARVRVRALHGRTGRRVGRRWDTVTTTTDHARYSPLCLCFPFGCFLSLRTDQDAHLDHLSSSIHRQHHISLQINDELEVHTGLLDTLDTELDGTDARMARARRRLARVARGAKENGTSHGWSEYALD